MPFVLAIEPDLRQAAIIKRVIRQQVHADLVLVDSRDAAMAALAAGVPDVVLVTALLSPRDEEELITHLRALDGADHLQTHTIPQLASKGAEARGGRAGAGLLGRFRKKKEAAPMPGCDPDLFAAQVRAFLERAAELKSEAAASPIANAKGDTYAAAPAEPTGDTASPAIDTGSAWSAPFEWRRPEPTQDAPDADVETPLPRREPLVKALPLAVIAEEEERRRTEDLAAEAEHSRLAAVEAQRVCAQAAAEKAEAELRRVGAEAARAERDRLRVEAEAAARAERERLRVEAEAEASAKAEADAKARVEAEALAAEAAKAAEAPIVEDAFAEFREDADAERDVFRLMPLAIWARREVPPQPTPEPAADLALHDLLSHLALPAHVAGVTYPRGCRIRRVRVPAPSSAARTRATHPVILSKRALEEMRAAR